MKRIDILLTLTARNDGNLFFRDCWTKAQIYNRFLNEEMERLNSVPSLFSPECFTTGVVPGCPYYPIECIRDCSTCWEAGIKNMKEPEI